MKNNPSVDLKDVQAVYSGPEADLWELVMGEQIHIGGLRSSMDLAEKAGVGTRMSGIDLCCCTGAGMRFLVRFRNVERMHGVDATEKVVQRGRERCREQGLADRIDFTLADVCDTSLPSGAADFVWGEDAWCYVVDKPALITEAVRLVRPGGVVALTDWVLGPASISDDEAERFLRFMKFPNMLSIEDYCELFHGQGCRMETAENTGRFAPHADLYINMLEMQLTYDALRIIGFDQQMLAGLAGEMGFLRCLAHEGKIAQGLFVARKPG